MSRRSTLSLKPKPGKQYSEGRRAGELGLSKHNNPYRRGTREWYSWDQGWIEGSDKYMEDWQKFKIYKED